MSQENAKDPVFSPLVDLSAESIGKQVNTTTSGSEEVMKRIAEIDSEEKDLYKTLLKTSDDIREIKEVQQQDLSKLNSNTKEALQKEMKNLKTLQKSIKTQIESLGKIRIQLYKSLGEKYIDLQTVVGESRNDLVDQKTVADLMSSQLQGLEGEYANLKKEKSRKARLTEIDTYYSKRYRSYSDLMKLIAYVCIPLLLVAVVYRMEYISDNIRSTLVMIVLAIGGYLIFKKCMDIWYRDNMNWDQYRWSFNQNGRNESVWEYDKRQLKKLWGRRDEMMDQVARTLGFACVNENCCQHDKVMWDKDKKTCVMKNDTSKSDNSNSDKVTSDIQRDGFTPLHAAPVCPTGKSLGSQVNKSCGIACDLGNLSQNYCGGVSDGSIVSGFDGF